MQAEAKQSARTRERNKAILQARNLLEIPDWLIFSSQITSFSDSQADCPLQLVSVAIMAPNRQVLLDACICPSGRATAAMLRRHGTNQMKLSDAVSAASLLGAIADLCDKRDVLCWDLPLQVRNLGVIATLAAQAPPPLRTVSVQACFAGFVSDETDDATFKMQPLPGGSCVDNEEVSAPKECQNIVELIYMMAGSSQVSESATVLNKNWSATFYKPKQGPAQKLKSFFGFVE